jgi:hypothetical protein
MKHTGLCMASCVGYATNLTKENEPERNLYHFTNILRMSH